MGIKLGIVQVNAGEDSSQKSFGLVQSLLQCFNVLGGGVSPAIGRLIISAFCGSRLVKSGKGGSGEWRAYHSYRRCNECRAACRRI